MTNEGIELALPALETPAESEVRTETPFLEELRRLEYGLRTARALHEHCMRALLQTESLDHEQMRLRWAEFHRATLKLDAAAQAFEAFRTTRHPDGPPAAIFGSR